MERWWGGEHKALPPLEIFFLLQKREFLDPPHAKSYCSPPPLILNLCAYIHKMLYYPFLDLTARPTPNPGGGEVLEALGPSDIKNGP